METEVNLIDHKTRDAWLAARNHSIGASESAALFGLAPDSRESAYSLWAKKAGMIAPDPIDEEWLEWGHAFEPAISEIYSKRTGHVLWTPPSQFCVAVHPRLPFMTATVDRWIIEAAGRTGRGVLEIKNVGEFAHDWRDETGVAVPLYVQIQVQHQLAVTGFSWGAIAPMIGGNRLRPVEVERNEKFIAELEANAEAFWKLVQSKTPPKVDGKEATTRAIKKLNPADNGETISLSQEALHLWEALQTMKSRESMAGGAAEALENELREMIGPNTFGALPDGRKLSLKTTSRKGYTSPPVEATTFRTLKLEKPAKEKR